MKEIKDHLVGRPLAQGGQRRQLRIQTDLALTDGTRTEVPDRDNLFSARNVDFKRSRPQVFRMRLLIGWPGEIPQYPLSIYSTWLRRFFTLVVPLAATAYYPVVAILGRPDPLQPRAWLPWISPLAGFAFLGLSLLFWRLGVRHYTSTGS